MPSLLIAILMICAWPCCHAAERPDWIERPVGEAGVRGCLFVHEGQARPTILVLGGSEGGFEGARPLASVLAGLGYNAFAFAYFGVQDMPPALVKIPLESFCKALDWLERQPFVLPGALGIAGGSKGAEAALLVAGLRPELRVVVAYLPTHVVWECIDEAHGTAASSWTLAGKELPFVPYRRRDSSSAASNYGWETVRDLHIASLATAEPAIVTKALIPIENIHGAVLLFSAGGDLVWPSTSSADAIEKRARTLKRPPVVKHVNFPDAGHAFLHGTADGGGTEKANRTAQKESLRELQDFLSQYLFSETTK